METSTISSTKPLIISQASAGAGKTFMLAKTFIKLSFDAPNDEALKSRFTHILAITFTNKATNEMKERIMLKLKEMSEDPAKCDMAEVLASELNIDYNELKRKATIVHSAILHNYSDLSVCTIDSFMQRVVRTFAHDLGLPMNYEVSLDMERIVHDVVDQMMSSIGEDNNDLTNIDLTNILTTFIERRMEDDKSTDIERSITEFCKKLFDEDVQQHIDKVKDILSEDFKTIELNLRKANDDFKKEIKERAEEALKQCEDNGWTEEDFYRKTSGPYGLITKLKNGNIESPNSYVQEVLEDETLLFKDKDKGKGKEDILLTPIIKLKEGIEIYNSRKRVLKDIFSLALLNTLSQRLHKYYDENEQLHNSEFNQRIGEVVEDQNDMPFVYERLGTHYWNYLFDEFQDTSRLQWHNLLPLVENALSEDHTSLIVGDGKQAIYRFRQGDAHQFVILPKVEDDKGNTVHDFTERALIAPLDTNYRSFKNIIQFNNKFYYWAIKNRFGHNTELQNIYIGKDEDPALWQKEKKEGEGYVELRFLTKKEDDEHGSFLEQCYETIYQTIISQRAKGYAYKDICIIARKNKTLSDICQYLSSKTIDGQPIPFVSSESFLLDNSRVVQLLLALMRYINNNNDRAAATQVLILLHELGKMQKDHQELILDQQSNATQKQGSHAPIRLIEILNKELGTTLSNNLHSMSVYECCEELIRQLDLGDIEPAFTASMLNIAASYSQNNHQDLAAFLQWYDETNSSKAFSAKTSDDMDAIKLYTIHKAKGLEADIIIYPIIPKKGNNKDTLWVDIDEEQQQKLFSQNKPLPIALLCLSKKESTIFNKERDYELNKTQIDNINVLYVATTRPRHKLFLIAEKPKTAKKTDSQATDDASLLDGFANQENSIMLYDEDKKTFYIGTDGVNPSMGKSDNDNANGIINLKMTSFANWEGRLHIISDEQNEGDVARLHGIAVHDILSMIVTKDDLDKAFDNYFHTVKCSADEQSLIRQEVSAIVLAPECAKFFTPDAKVLCESEIMYGETTRRIDRFVSTDNHTYVIDFKTGEHEAEHHKQVKEYCDLISQMDYTGIEGYLIYVNNNSVELVSVV